MKTTRRKFTSKLMAQVAIKAIKERGHKTDPAKRSEVHPAQITTWKRDELRGQGLENNEKRTRRLMRKMCLMRFFIKTSG